MEKIFVLLETC